ncbi:hypothetical protein FZB77_12730 [Enterococcus faecium]|nr:hypothetical protein [Enterococcus faecium]MCZ1297519.1 hypothetical protein [Enterococcus faecium]MCZ1300243.1 hypothetical protein [Enterococcus faecium]MCZ1308459.1 hypothetical protein [Enterococcus faecium]MCZ1313987.1 hypothetical protein [Enterococcus faecium]
MYNPSVLIDKEPKNLSQNVVHSDPDLILHNSSVLIDKEPILLVDVWKRYFAHGEQAVLLEKSCILLMQLRVFILVSEKSQKRALLNEKVLLKLLINRFL